MNHVETQVATCGPVLEAATARIMAALARVLLRYGVSIQAFTDISKRAYLDAAKRDFTLPGRKLTRSRVALLTGLTRKEVLRLQASLHVESDRAPLSRANRAGRVIAGWRRDLRAVLDGTAIVASEVKEQSSGGSCKAIVQARVTAKDDAARTLVMLGITVNLSGGGVTFRDANENAVSAVQFFAAVTASANSGTLVKAKGSFSGASLLTGEEAELEN